MRASPTKDLDQACADLDEHGYCIVEDALDAATVRRVRRRVEEQASAERAAGRAFVQDGNTQWVANVLNKGEEFVELLTCAPQSLEVVRHVLGSDFILSCSNAPIAGPGNERMRMHSDQYWTPRIAREPASYERLGDRRFEDLSFAGEPEAREHLFPPCMVTLMWAITDFTDENGATVFVPGSHRSGSQPLGPAAAAHGVPAEMRAGSFTLWDGRTWHATGTNRTEYEHRIGVTQNWVAPMIRPLVNYAYSLRPEVRERLDETEKKLLGFATWSAYGNEGVPSQHNAYFVPAAQQLGKLTGGQ